MIVEITHPRPENISWTLPGSWNIIKEEDGYVWATIPDTGKYTITLRAYLGECADSVVKTIHVTKNPRNRDEFRLGYYGIKNCRMYPNPNSGRFTLDVELTDEEDINILIFNSALTNQVLEEKLTGLDHYNRELDISNIPPGLYFLEVKTSRSRKTMKFVKY